jgi:hypothetical protein
LNEEKELFGKSGGLKEEVFGRRDFLLDSVFQSPSKPLKGDYHINERVESG